MFLKEIKSVKESKSYNSAGYNNLSFLYDNASNQIIGEPLKKSFTEEIECNTSIATIIQKQLSILTEGELALYERTKTKDIESKNKTALTLFDILQQPNCRPSPKNFDAILKYCIESYHYNGVYALVMCFDGEYSPQNLKYLTVGDNVQYVSSGGVDYYNISLNNKAYNMSYNFVYNQDYNTYITQNGSDVMVALVNGNYNYNRCSYITPWYKYKNTILLENYVNEYAKSFHENSCRPSSIITLTYKDIQDHGRMPNRYDREELDKLIQNFRSELKGASNGGKFIIPNDPNLVVEVTPLNIPSNADDMQKQLDITTNTIYSAINGGSKSVILGENEYSNNALEKQKEFYDGTLSFINDTLMQPLNTFLKEYLQEFDRSASSNDIYFAIDRSSIEFYKKYIEEKTSLKYRNNEMTLNEVRKIHSELREEWGDLIPLEGGNRLYSEIEKSNTIV